ncbi:MAG: hypothetical protein ACRD2W_02755 [Acidimicrobiales bacterium]
MTRDIRIAEHLIAAGDLVLSLLGAANRDPARFTDPDRLDVGRSEGSPLSFWQRYPLLSRRGAGPARRPDRVRPPGGPLQEDRTGRRYAAPPGQPTLRGLLELPVHFAA